MELKKLKKHLEGIIFKEKEPFVTHREVNWQKLGKLMGLVVLFVVLMLLFFPTPEPHQAQFREGKEDSFEEHQSHFSSGDSLTLASGGYSYKPTGNFDYLSSSRSFSHQQTQERDRNTSMILARPGMDGKNQLPPGARIPIRLNQAVLVSGQPMPVIATVTEDVAQESSVAIPEGSLLFGEMAFEDSSDRATVAWRSLQFPDGRERQISGMGLGLDGQLGVEGQIHSDGFKNAAGQFLSRFIGAYAEGSMQKGVLGASDGGASNGFKNAVAETAKDRSSAFAEDMKKQRRWIEVPAGVKLLAIINQPFTFRDPGASNGQ